jgi:hypothetical protein
VNNVDSQSEELDRRLGRLAIPEDRYKADIDLHDRSLNFSAELVRLALAGIAVVGFLIANAPDDRATTIFGDGLLRGAISIALVALAGASAFALLHRFYAGGAAFHHLQVIKLLSLNDPAFEGRLKEEMEERTILFMRSHKFLIGASVLLIAGALSLGLAFVRFLFA